MKGQGLTAFAAFVAILVVLQGVQFSLISNKIAQVIEPSRVQAHTVVYIPDGQGSRGVPIYEIPGGLATADFLPNFTLVDMICWDDVAEQRYFRVRVDSGAAVRAGQVVVVRAVDTHNQTLADRC